jgi:esterase
MQLHFQTFGQGEPLILLHGLLGSLENWHSASLKLARHFQVFAVDQRNHGRSPHSPEMDYPLMAEDVYEFLRSQNLAHAHVLGHSMGGKTAMQLALLHPEAVDKLVVADIAPRAYSSHHGKLLEGLLALNLARFETRQQMEAALAPSIPDLATRQFLLKNLGHAPGVGYHWKIGLREIHSNYARLSAALADGHPFEGPTLFVRGERSDYLWAEDLPELRRLFPRTQLKVIPRAGHLVHTENAPAFLQTVIEFLAGVERE